MTSFDGILEHYLSRLDRGESPNRNDYLVQYPEHVTELGQFFENLDFVDRRLASPPGESTAPLPREATAAPSYASSTPQVPNGILPEIKGFRILSELGRGSQGVVYKAEQGGTKRTVALKVVRDGLFASDHERRRFETEVELASRLSHPNVVSIYHCGRDGGYDHFAMEYVEGEPLDVYLSARALGIEAILQLFLQVGGAVAYAHQRGVIHRDLKPSNMIVDGAGIVHVLDFGLAKAMPGTSSSLATMMTQTGEFAGTWYYASPEQAARDPDRVDVRTDVYSLGVVLYEMLTDCYPYPIVGEPREVVAQHIQETAPSRPSSIRAEIDNELDTIVLHALRKAPNGRYQSAAAFAEDVGRYLAGEPILAKRDSRWYLLYATARRYRWYVAGTAACVAALVALAFVYALLYSRAAAAHATAELRSQMSRRVQIDLVARLDELNSLSNRYAAISSARPDLPELAIDRRPPLAVSLEPWTELVSRAPADVFEKILDPAMPGHLEASRWLARHEAELSDLRRLFTTHNLRPGVVRSPEWELRHTYDSLAVPKSLGKALAALAIYHFRQDDAGSAVTSLEAARFIALDLADGPMLSHKATSVALRNEIYDAVLTLLSRELTIGVDEGLIRWTLQDPPLVGFRLAMISEGLKLEQLWEAATFTDGANEGAIDVNVLDKLTEGLYTTLGRRVPLDVHPQRLQERTREFMHEVQLWDDLCVPLLDQRYALLLQRLRGTPEWWLMEPVAPAAAQGLRIRASANAKRGAVILAAHLCRYRRESAEWPPSLDAALPPERAAPDIRDPYSGLPFGYRIVDEKPVIYSVNADGADDGGRPGRWGEPNTDVVLFPLSNTPSAHHGEGAAEPPGT